MAMNDSRRTRSNVVIHALSSGGLYGIERMLLNLLPELQRKGCPVLLLCLDGAEAEIVGAADRLGIPTAAVNCGGRVTPRGWLDLYRTIGAHAPRLVHVHGYKATILAGAASIARRVPTVATYHGVAAKAGEHSKSLARYLAIETPVLRRFRGTAAVSGQIADELKSRRVPENRIRVIANGITLPTAGESGRTRSDRGEAFSPCILSLSRLAPEKNVHLVIDAVAELRRDFPNIGLVVAGDGDLRPTLEARAASLGIQDVVRFVGFVRDVRPLYDRCDVFVLASQTEGMPMALLETMALGLPIVASRVGGIPLMLNEGLEALLIEPNDASSLYEALHRVLTDDLLRTGLASRARERFERDYTAERMADAYMRFYDDIAPRVGQDYLPEARP